MTDSDDDLVFVPLGGLGEIGMNTSLFGYGRGRQRQWIMVDLGVSFAGPDLPGLDLLMPDLSFVADIRRDLLGLVITHGHEDHIGAVADLWPRVKCPLYATPFAAGLLRTKRLSEPGAPEVPINVVQQSSTITLGPFSIEFIPVAHSIPESCALAIRTPAGTVVHTGDWKIDATPVVGRPTDEARLAALGQEGVMALICDSTNILRDGESPSEADVAQTLATLIAASSDRVVVTTFASNVARVRSVALAAQAAGRSVVLAGRSMFRVAEVARECGYLDGVPEFLPPDNFSHLARDQVVVLATGSQGEARAAIARIAVDDHPDIRLAPGDRVIFSSRPIPGNEKAIASLVNGLIDLGIDVVTDRTHLVHVSGHPRRAEVERFYGWIKPAVAIPTHGEPQHLAAHAAFARALGVPDVVAARNGDMVRLGPGSPGIVDQVASGRLGKDGAILVSTDDPGIASRRRLATAGVISIGLAVTRSGDLAGDPDMIMAGLPERTRDDRTMDAVIDKAIFDIVDHLPRAKRRDADVLAGAVERAVRNAVQQVWGKKPTVHVLVMEVEGRR